MNPKFINVGYGNIVHVDRIIAIVTPDSAPVKRMIQNGQDNGTAIDATCGRKTEAVIVTDTGQIILSGVRRSTLAMRLDPTRKEEDPCP